MEHQAVPKFEAIWHIQLLQHRTRWTYRQPQAWAQLRLFFMHMLVNVNAIY